MVVCAFVIFRAETIKYAAYYFKVMFTGFYWTDESMLILWRNLVPMNICMIIVGVLCMHSWESFRSRINVSLVRLANSKAEYFMMAGKYVITLMLLFLSMLNLASNVYNPFIYFRF